MTDGEIFAREGDILASAGRLEEALSKYEEALRADELVNKHHPDVASRYCAIGALYRTVGDNDAATEYFTRAVQVEEASEHYERRVGLAVYLSNLAGVLRAAGRLSSANDHYCRALDHLRAVIPPDAARVAAREDRRMFDDDASDDVLDPSPDARSPSHFQITNEPAKLLGRGGVLDVAGSALNNLGLLMKSAGSCTARDDSTSAPSRLAVVATGEHDPVIAIRTRNLGAALLGLGYARAAEKKLEYARRARARWDSGRTIRRRRRRTRGWRRRERAWARETTRKSSRGRRRCRRWRSGSSASWTAACWNRDRNPSRRVNRR